MPDINLHIDAIEFLFKNCELINLFREKTTYSCENVYTETVLNIIIDSNRLDLLQLFILNEIMPDEKSLETALRGKNINTIAYVLLINILYNKSHPFRSRDEKYFATIINHIQKNNNISFDENRSLDLIKNTTSKIYNNDRYTQLIKILLNYLPKQINYIIVTEYVNELSILPEKYEYLF